MGRGGYHASQIGRRLRGWEATRQTINSLLATGGEELIARSRQLVRENPYAANAKEAFVGAAVGSGIKPSSQHPDKDTRAAIQEAFLRWTDEADADGVTDFYGLQALATGGMFEGGDVFVRFRSRLPKDGLSVPLQLQLYESEMLSYRKNETAPNGNIIREGIEFDAIGRRTAYWFFKTHPGEIYPVLFDFSFNRVPASEVIHLFRPNRIGSIRGQPQLTPSMVRLYLLDVQDDAELARKQVATLFAGFVSKKSPISDNPLTRQPSEEGGDEETGEPLPADTGVVPMEPGQIQVLNDDEQITFSSPSEVGGSYEAFQWRSLLAIAAGCGVPYADMTTDTSQSNYSSDRADQIKFRRRMDQFQHQTLVYQFCRPVWDRWFQVAVLAGAIPVTPREMSSDPRGVSKVKWIPPAWDWVDPLKDGKAFQLATSEGWGCPFRHHRDAGRGARGYRQAHPGRPRARDRHGSRVPAAHDPRERQHRRHGGHTQRCGQGRDERRRRPRGGRGAAARTEAEPVGRHPFRWRRGESSARPDSSPPELIMPCIVNGSTIVLSGDVGDMGWYYDDGDRGFGSGDVISALAQIGDGKDVTVRLNSGGGIATEGSAIHAALSRHKGRKTIYVEGVAASSASVIAMAGDEVVVCPGALMMVHDPAGVTVGTVSDHEIKIAALTALGDAMASVYAAKTGRPVAECRADMAAETWMTPDQAVAKGYADRVEGAPIAGVEPAEPARFPYTAYHHAPSRMVALARAHRWDRPRITLTAQAATTEDEEATMPLNEDDKAFINTTIASAIAAVLKDGSKKTDDTPVAGGAPSEPAPVAALRRSETSAIAQACMDGGVPGMTASLLAEGVTLAVAQSRIGQAGSIKDMVALARQGTPGIPADFADTMIAAGKTVDGVRAELFNQMVAKGAGSDDAGVRSFHRAGAGGADHGGEPPTLQTGKPTAAVRSRGVALMAAEVERQGMTPKRRA